MLRQRLIHQDLFTGRLLVMAAVLAGCSDAAQVAAPLKWSHIPSLAIVPLAEAGYLAETGKIDVSGIADLTVLNSISDGTQTVTFSSFMGKRSVPNNWAMWGSPPYTESATPHLLFPQVSSPSLIMTLAQPSPVFGFEVMASQNALYSFTALFFAGNTVVESVTQDIPGSEARLFAVSADQPISRAIVFINENPPPTNFAIAQVRYGTAADIQVTIDGRAGVDRTTGEALVAGTISCSRPIAVSFDVSLTQNQKSRSVPTTLAVTEGLAISCGTPGSFFPWSAALTM